MNLHAVTTDGFGQLVHQVLTTWDSRGLPDTQTDPEGVHDYEHDQAGRLVAVDHPAGAAFADEAYTYDAADRRTSSHVDPLAEVVYDASDRLLQDGQYTYDYDAEGRRTSREDRFTGAVTTYAYNAQDQMTSLTDEAGVTWEYVYDARDLRVLVTNSAGYGEAFVYDLRGTVRGSYDASTGATTATYLAGFGFGEVLARVDGQGNASSALRDRLGSTVGWLDANGQVAEHVLRDAYGVLAATPASVMPFGYTGHAEDPTGLVWGRARCYAPTTGAWTSEDPVFTEGRYGYASGGVTYGTDPTGRALVVDYGLMVTCVGAVAGPLAVGVGMASVGSVATTAGAAMLVGSLNNPSSSVGVILGSSLVTGFGAGFTAGGAAATTLATGFAALCYARGLEAGPQAPPVRP